MQISLLPFLLPLAWGRLRQSPNLVRSMAPDRARRNTLLREHNRYRAQVPASDMQLMFWDTRLARTAQAYAEKCNFEHSTDRVGVGENIWAASYSNYTEAILLFFDEVYDPNCGCQREYKKCCGHYTQVVWAETNRVGCGAAECRSVHAAPGQRFVLICHYSPTGNWTGRKAFQWIEPGKPACSKCPSSKKRCWKNRLCF